MRKVILTILSLCLVVTWTVAQTSNFNSSLDEAQANAGAGTGSAGIGTATANYDASTMTLTVSGSFSGLTGNTSSCHVHDGVAGSNGGVVFGLTLSPSGTTSGSFTGSGTLSAAQETTLLANGFYINVHTSTVPSGEIRGQIIAVTKFNSLLNEAQANAGAGTGSAGIGAATADYDASTMTLTVSGSFSGLTGTTSSCHVHDGVAGSNGGVVFGLTLSPSGATSGSFSGSGTLSAAQETTLMTNGFYINVHTSTVSGGEIRGQIIKSTLNITLNEAQANAGAGTGSAGLGVGTGSYDPSTNTLMVSGSFSGLTGNTSSCHVHDGVAGSNGGVVFALTLSPSGTTEGSFSGSGVLTPTQQATLSANGFYVNVHTSTVTSGEIRGQIISDGTPLPVEMLYFKGNSKASANVLEWATATELNNDFFEVQHSTDGEVFNVIERVEGFGTKLETSRYTYTDENPVTGRNYYRLRQVDFDLKFEYSEVIVIDNETQLDIKIYPNPTTAFITIENGSGMASIYTINGMLVKQVDLAQTNKIDIRDFQNGQYYLIEEGKKMIPFIKN